MCVYVKKGRKKNKGKGKKKKERKKKIGRETKK
jgi:hypothetical protein